MKKAFTLIELLIAATIFMIVMAMVASIMSWSSNYIGKLREMRNALTDGNKIAEMISSDLRLANGEAQINDNRTTPSEKIGEFVLLQCNNNSRTDCLARDGFVYAGSDEHGIITALNDTDSATTYDASNLSDILIVQKDRNKYIRYHSEYSGSGGTGTENYNIFRSESTLPAIIDLSSAPAGGWKKLNNNTSVKAVFNGFVNNKAAGNPRRLQPYIRFALKAQSINYSQVLAPQRSTMILRSLIASRDYN